MKNKNIILGIMMAVLACSMSSCVIDEADTPSSYTSHGYMLYRTGQMNTFFFLTNMVDKGFVLNAWISASDSAKRVLEDKYLTNYKVWKESDGVYGIYSGKDLLYTIETGNLPLTDPNADWVLKCELKQFQQYQFNYDYYSQLYTSETITQDMREIHLKNVSTPSQWSWNIAASGKDSLHSCIDFNVSLNDTEMCESLFEWDFSMTGSACYRFEKQYSSKSVDVAYMKLKIESPMRWTSNYDAIGNGSIEEAYAALNWHGGKMDMEIFNRKDDSLFVGVEFKGPYNVQITYKGKTEMWNVNDPGNQIIKE